MSTLSSPQKLDLSNVNTTASDLSTSGIKTTQNDTKDIANKNHELSQQNSKGKEKSKGWLSFINEKLSQWPLWVKLTGSDQVQKQSLVSEPKKEEGKPKRRFIKTLDLPWRQFFQRGSLKTVYYYYHNPEDKMTYFYPIQPQSHEQTHKEIFEVPPEGTQYHRMRGFNCIMPTEKVIELLKQDIQNQPWSL